MDSKARSMDHQIDIKGPIHLIGSCGIGMMGLCALFKSAGFKVTGSDINSSNPKSNKVSGVHYYSTHDAKHVQKAETVIYSSAIKANNPERLEAKKLGKTLLSRGEALAKIAQQFPYCIAIAGTHGKTSITALVSHLFSEAGLNPSYYIGGHPYNDRPLADFGCSDIFITETDESDGSFLLLSPYLSAISNIDTDHLSFYKSTDNIYRAFAKFIDNQVSNHKTILCNSFCKNLNSLYPKGYEKLLTVNDKGSNSLNASSVQHTSKGLKFILERKNCSLGEVECALYGSHNVENILIALAIALNFNISFSVLQRGLKSFKGVKQRMDILGEFNSIKVIQDYAHHPSAIQASLVALRQHFNRRLMVVFQPHRFSRLSSFFEEFSISFNKADHVFITQVYAAQEEEIEGCNSLALVNKIKKNNAISCSLLGDNYDKLLQFLNPQDIVVFFGAGNINESAKHFCDILKSHACFSQPLQHEAL